MSPLPRAFVPAGAMLMTTLAAGWAWSGAGSSFFDLDVYRTGGSVWLSGGHLYDALPATAQGIRLPFTYPPFAAIVLSPLSLIPAAAAAMIVTLATIGLLSVTLRIYLRNLEWPLAAILPLALVLEPVRSTIGFGQVDVMLMTLVTADCLTRAPRWPRGSLTGLAAAVKLTPLLFVLFFVLRRDYRAASQMTLTFVAATGLGFALAPADSVRYWTSVAFDTARIGDPVYAGNQSVLGVLARAGLRPGTPATTCLWLTLSVAVLTVAFLGMRRAIAAADVHLALALNALAVLLVSPISWSHHWVWAGPALLALAVAGRRGQLAGARTAAVCGLVMFVICPQWWFPHGGNRELHWAIWEQTVGGSYVIFAAGVLVLSLRIRPRLFVLRDRLHLMSVQVHPQRVRMRCSSRACSDLLYPAVWTVLLVQGVFQQPVLTSLDDPAAAVMWPGFRREKT